MSLSISSVFFLFLIFTTFASSSTSLNNNNNNNHKCSEKESEALLLFKHNLSSMDFTYSECQDWLGSDYHPMMSWNTNSDCCNWDGVTCDYSTGDVIEIDVSCGMLKGTIHPNSSLFNLPHLQTLNLAFNDFRASQIPREIGRFSNSLTHLNLSDCWFSGQVPSDFTLLHKLVSLDLSFNGNDNLNLGIDVFINMFRNFTNMEELSLANVDISSVLPTSINISSSLKLLNLFQTGLQGKLPRYIFNLHSLETLEMAFNSFTGDIPSDISVNLTHLTYLRLSNNKLNGTLPSWLFTSPSLEEIYVDNNMFTGDIPLKIPVNLTHLTWLDLSYNRLNGALPSWLFTSPSLQSLRLNDNMLSGNVPFESFTSPSLQVLDLSGNQLGGQIDVQTFPQLTNLVALGLGHNNFSGELELDSLLSTLTNLEELLLSYSGFSVTTKNTNHYVNPGFRYLYLASCKLKVFPNSFRAMKQLELLDLSSNEIHGQIPHWAGEIGGNHSLIYLDLSHNRIIGVIPKNISSSIASLNVKSNKIEGSFPPSICNMSNLQSLDISNNSMGGVIPDCVGSMMSTLSMINLGTNNFHGTIPNVFNECGVLEGLILNGNQLEGGVPHSLSKCQSLKVLDLGNNKLSGTFPIWLGGLSELQVLVLKSNNFHGPIETSTAVEYAFSSLQVLDLSHNWFAGKLPGTFFQNFKAMQNMVTNSPEPEYLSMDLNNYYYSIIVVVKDVQLTFTKLLVGYTILDLSNNRFEGEIPNGIGSLNSLKVLNLSHNNLNGEIPNALGKLLGTESLDLSWNQLIGEIPQSLAEIKGLAVLNISENHLVGRIPTGTQFNTFDESSYGGNLGLCGFPLSNKCEHLSSPDVYRDRDKEEVDESGFTWKVVTLGFGCGTLVGLVMGYLMLSTRKVKWFNEIADAAESLVLKKMKKKRRHISIGK